MVDLCKAYGCSNWYTFVLGLRLPTFIRGKLVKVVNGCTKKSIAWMFPTIRRICGKAALHWLLCILIRAKPIHESGCLAISHPSGSTYFQSLFWTNI